MSETEARRNVLKASLLLASAGLLGLVITLALAIQGQPVVRELEATIEVDRPVGLTASEIAGRAGAGGSIAAIEVKVTNTGSVPISVAWRGETYVLEPGESVSLEPSHLFEEIRVSSTGELRATIAARIGVLEGGNIVLSLIAAILFFASAVTASAGLALLFSLVIRR